MKSVFSYLFLLSSFSSFSQSSIEFNFCDIYIGRNLNFSWKKSVLDFSFSAGLTYHINRIEKVPIGIFNKNSAHGQNLGERFGIQCGLEYFFYKNSHSKIGLFYNNQISSINQVYKMYYATEALVPNPQSEFDFLFLKSERVYGPVITMDNVVGLTLRSNITDKIYLSTKGGFGLLFWKNTDDSFVLVGGKKNNQGYDFTSFFSIGLGYTITKK